jgi:outer membrane protein insertion porin family
MRITIKTRLTLLVLLLSFTSGFLQGQGLDLNTSPPEIERIRIEFKELRNVSEEVVRAQIQIRAGMTYNQNLVDRSIRSLYQTNLFDFIEARAVALPDSDRVELVFSLQSKYRIQEIRFSGNEEFSDSRLEGKTEARAGQVLDERRIRQDRDALLEYYREKGYTDATVEFSIRRNRETGLGIVTHTIDEGSKIRIVSVDFVGNQAFSNRKLRGEMKTSEHFWLWSWLTESGRFDETVFQEDLDLLRTFYRNEGYLDVSINESDVSLDYLTDRKLAITITVDEGRQYRVGDIQVKGNKVYESILLTRSLRMIPGDVFSPEKLNEDRERLQDIYGAAGYLDAFVRPERIPNLQTGDIDIIYNIEEGEKFFIESIVIEGNTKTKSVVVLRELALSPGQIFNMVWMKNAENRLKNTRFFDEVNLSPVPTNIPGRRDLKVSLQEGRTGQFQFGAGFSSLENVVFFFELSQGNFDLFNHRSFFQGDGQKFRLRGSIGSNSNEFVIAFEEPWFREQRLALGIEIFRRDSRVFSGWDELRAGFEIYARKRLIEFIDGRLSYTLQNVSIDLDNPANASQLLLDAEGETLLSKVGLTLVRDTRNHIIFTTNGTRYQFSIDWAGVGGDIKYLRLETRNSLFLPTFEFGEQVLSVLLRAGSFWAYAQEDVPLLDANGNEQFDAFGNLQTTTEYEVPPFDRFFLGGPNSLRGFEFRDVGPRDANGNIIGGNAYGFASLEYSIKVAEPLRLAMFYDWGFVNEDDFNFSPTNYNDNWGFGIRLLVLGNPLRLDFGIPLTTSKFRVNGVERDNDEGSQFNFSFGTRF